MKLEIFSVYDDGVSAFLQPFYARTRSEAVRSFSDAVNGDRNSQFSRHARDYVLMHLGTWDDTDGSFLPSNPSRVIGASDVVADLEAKPEVPPPLRRMPM